MDFSWEETKRLHTLADRGLDFADAAYVFDGRQVVHQPTPRNDEDRLKSTARTKGNFYTVVWLWRGERRHIVSMRRAHAQEIRKYRDLHG